MVGATGIKFGDMRDCVCVTSCKRVQLQENLFILTSQLSLRHQPCYHFQVIKKNYYWRQRVNFQIKIANYSEMSNRESSFTSICHTCRDFATLLKIQDSGSHNFISYSSALVPILYLSYFPSCKIKVSGANYDFKRCATPFQLCFVFGLVSAILPEI